MSAATQRVEPRPVQHAGQLAERISAAALDRVLASERSKRRRERQRAGKVVLPIEIDHRTVEAMLLVNMVSEDESRCRQCLAAAIQEALANWSKQVIEISRHA
jgi:hypothetical protein